MTPRELKDRFRADVSDAEMPGSGDDSDSLWKDLEVYNYADLAFREFAKITEYFLDSTTVAITELELEQDNPWVSINPKVIKIIRSKLVGTPKKLHVVKAEELDSGYLYEDYGLRLSAGWEDEVGVPEALITNLERDRIRVVPTPVEDYTVRLTVVRYPLEHITRQARNIPLETTDPMHIDAILDGMKMHAYSKQDADVYNVDMSTDYRNKFYSKLGDIKQEIKRLRKPARSVQYGGL